MTIEEIELSHHQELRQVRPEWIGTDKDVPFGLGQKRWEEFKSFIQDGDIIETYNDIGPLCGSAGYCIVRDNKIIRYYATIMS